MAITPLPTPPSRSDPVNFATRADTFLGALPTMVDEFNASMAGESAAGLAGTLASTAAGDGTARLGCFDAGGYWAGSNQEDINQEAGLALLKSRRYSVNIMAKGAARDGVTDDFPAYAAARTEAGSNGVVYLPGPGTYYFAGSRPDLSGCHIQADPDVVLRVDENPNTKDVKCITTLTIENTVHGTTLRKPANYIHSPEVLSIAPTLVGLSTNEQHAIVDISVWLHKVYATATGDVSTTNGTATVTSSQATWGTAFTANPQVFYPASIADGVMYEVSGASAAGTNDFGVFVKVSDGVWQARISVGVSTLKIRKVSNAGAIVTTVDYALPNGGAYGWISGQEATVGFVVRSGVTTVLVNGLPVYRISEVALVAGFLVLNGVNTNSVTIKDILSTTNFSVREKRSLNIGVIGDSISYGAWCSLAIEDLLPMAAQNLPGIGDVAVTNYSVSGTNSGQWVTTTSTADYSAHDVVLCMLGTNDLQGAVSTGTYISNMTSISANIIADGAVPIFGIWPVFTQAAVSGITGVTTSNYANHAKYTHALKKWCIQNGHEFADVRRAFGANIQWYGDNIHPTVEGQIAVMGAWAEALQKYQSHLSGVLF